MSQPKDIVAVGKKAYLFCTSDGDNTIKEFDSQTNKITTLSTKLPRYYDYVSVGTVNENIYILGGSRNTSYYSEILEFNPKANTIETLSVSLPKKADGIGVATGNGKIYMFGGFEKDVGRFDDVWEFIPKFETQDSWGYLIQTDTTAGVYTKTSSNEFSSIIKVFDCQTSANAEAYSILNGVVTKIE